MINFLTELAANPIFGGAIGVSILYLLKDVPLKLLDLLVWRLTTTLTIYNDDSTTFDVLSEWLTDLSVSKKTRHLRLTSIYDEAEETKVISTPGEGYHLLKHRGKYVVVYRERVKGEGSFYKVSETIILRALGPNVEFLQNLVQEIVNSKGDQRNGLDFYIYRSFWKKIARKAKRPLESIFLPQAQLKGILADLQWFIGSQEWHVNLGIPWRRSICLEGPPGTGKTSLVIAVAGHLNRPIYCLNLGSLKGDGDLIDAVSSVPGNAVLLIEDIDAVSKKREKKEEAKEEEPEAVSLSALLNSIDGVFAKDGRILFMTTNHPENVDPALLRKGRSDRREVIGAIGPTEIQEMCVRFLGPEDDPEFSKTLPHSITASDLQELLKAKVQDKSVY